MSKKQDATQYLDVNRDLHDLTYKIPGLLAWSILGLTAIGFLLFPRFAMIGTRLFAFYLLARMLALVVFYPVGLVRCRVWEARAKSGRRDAVTGADYASVHHVVVIPNYREPTEVLTRTLEALAKQQDARRRITVVLAMEEADPGARAKADDLHARFKGRFAHVLVTFHPASLPGEVAGKGPNVGWAARQAKRELVDGLGMSIENLTLTSCDADSIFHPYYFAEITRLFAEDPRRHRRFWQAPPLADSNIWQVPAPVRVVTYLMNALQLAELARPFALTFPFSTYTLSLKLADDVDYWDGAVIAEDWHMFLRSTFGVHGQVRLIPVFLPTSIEAVAGETTVQALKNLYRQQLRHSWGCQDAGYILQQWRRESGPPPHKRLLYLVRVLEDHVVVSSGALVVAVGSLLATMLGYGPMLTWPNHPFCPVFVWWLITILWIANLLVTVGVVGILLMERMRCTTSKQDWSLPILAKEVIAWIFLAVVTIVVFALPRLHAQGKLVLGSRLSYVRTPRTMEAKASTIQ